MLDESQLDEFLDEFFGEEAASDAVRLKNSGKQNPFHRKEVPSEELEEYTLPSDGWADHSPDEKRWKSQQAYMGGTCADGDYCTADPLSFSENFSRKKIYGVQPDRCCCSDASVFYDV